MRWSGPRLSRLQETSHMQEDGRAIVCPYGGCPSSLSLLWLILARVRRAG